MHLGQGCITLSVSQDWQQLHVKVSYTNGNTERGEENSKSKGFQDLQLMTWSRIWSRRQDCNVWEMPLQWLLIHAVQHKCKMQCKHVNHSVSLGLHSICLCLLPWPSEVKPKPALNTSRSSHRCSCLRRLGFESCTATNTSWYAFNPNASFKHSDLCSVPQLPIPT